MDAQRRCVFGGPSPPRGRALGECRPGVGRPKSLRVDRSGVSGSVFVMKLDATSAGVCDEARCLMSLARSNTGPGTDDIPAQIGAGAPVIARIRDLSSDFGASSEGHTHTLAPDLRPLHDEPPMRSEGRPPEADTPAEGHARAAARRGQECGVSALNWSIRRSSLPRDFCHTLSLFANRRLGTCESLLEKLEALYFESRRAEIVHVPAIVTWQESSQRRGSASSAYVSARGCAPIAHLAHARDPGHRDLEERPKKPRGVLQHVVAVADLRGAARALPTPLGASAFGRHRAVWATWASWRRTAKLLRGKASGGSPRACARCSRDALEAHKCGACVVLRAHGGGGG